MFRLPGKPPERAYSRTLQRTRHKHILIRLWENAQITKRVSPALRSRAQPADTPRRKPPPPPQRATDGSERWQGKGRVRGVAQGTTAAAKGVPSPRVYIPPVLEIGHVYSGEWFGEEVVRLRPAFPCPSVVFWLLPLATGSANGCKEPGEQKERGKCTYSARAPSAVRPLRV
jgi:hypothetical protein